MARDLSRAILCAAVACTKSAVVPRNRGKPNGWVFAVHPQ